jgi:hypothetical protein
VAEEKLRSSLRRSVDRFVKDLFDSLDRLVDKEICGLVEWTSQSTCCCHFFREVIIQEREETRTELRETQVGSVRYLDGDKVESGTHTHRLARHEYHTGYAFQTRMSTRPAIHELLVADVASDASVSASLGWQRQLGCLDPQVP